MHCARKQGLRVIAPPCSWGSDQPVLDENWLAEAARALSRPNGAWLAPTQDGGYWAIGLRRAEARLFQGIHGSTRHVAHQARQRMRRCGLQVTMYPRRLDVDDGPD